MASDDILLDAEDRMEKTLDNLKDQFRTIRSGRASMGLVEQLRVDYYGTPTHLKAMANISVPDARSILIRPFDPSACGDVEKAILQSDLGMNPNSDGKLIRLNVPPLSEERRRKIVGQIKGMAEESKTSVRNIRRDANKAIDKGKKDGTLTEDDVFGAKEAVQEFTNDYEKKIDEALDSKSKEMMEV